MIVPVAKQPPTVNAPDAPQQPGAQLPADQVQTQPAATAKKEKKKDPITSILEDILGQSN